VSNFNRPYLKLLVALAMTVVLAGCAQKIVNPEPLAALPAVGQSMGTPYRIGVGDELEIKFFFAPELNDRMFVRPDGKISVMFAQDIQATGLTADELASDIRAVLAPHIKQLDLVIVVRSFASQKVFVGGEVAKPGPILLSTGPETVMQVLDEAGWVTPASGDRVLLVRRDPAGKEKIYPVEFNKLMNGEDLGQNVLVQAGDLVLVPPSDPVTLDRWVDQNIRQALPFSTGVGVSYNVNSNPKNN
jgi:protein involved in polysaccharide export with SLBB domain